MSINKNLLCDKDLWYFPIFLPNIRYSKGILFYCVFIWTLLLFYLSIEVLQAYVYCSNKNKLTNKYW